MPPGKAKTEHPSHGCAKAGALCQVRLNSHERLDPKAQLGAPPVAHRAFSPRIPWPPQHSLLAGPSQRGIYCWKKVPSPQAHPLTAERVRILGLDQELHVPTPPDPTERRHWAQHHSRKPSLETPAEVRGHWRGSQDWSPSSQLVVSWVPRPPSGSSPLEVSILLGAPRHLY